MQDNNSDHTLTEERPTMPAPARTTSGLDGPWSEDTTDAVDPRVSPALRATDADLDAGLARQFSDAFRHQAHPVPNADAEKQASPPPDEKAPIYVEFAPGDPRDPANYSVRRKWAMTFYACLFTALSGTLAPRPCHPRPR
jgi:hypothetical protein